MTVPYTVRFALATGVADTGATLFTASPSYAWVIRDIIVEVQVPSTAIYLSLVSGERSVNLIRQPLAAAGIVHLELRQRMEGGDYLQLYVADAPWSVAVTGYQLQLQ